MLCRRLCRSGSLCALRPLAANGFNAPIARTHAGSRCCASHGQRLYTSHRLLSTRNSKSLKETREPKNEGGAAKKDEHHDEGDETSGSDEDDAKKTLVFNIPPLFVLVALGMAGYALYDAARDAWAQHAAGDGSTTLADFVAALPAREDVEHIVVRVSDGVVRVVFKSGADARAPLSFTVPSAEAFEKTLAAAQEGVPPAERLRVVYDHAAPHSLLGSLALPAGIVAAWALYAGFRGMLRSAVRSLPGGASGGLFGVGRSRARLFSKEKAPRDRLADVAGMDEAREEVREFVDFLRTPERFVALGARVPRGAVISGPPGTGKTLLARAVAGEAGVPFLSASGSEFVEMLVGVGAARVRDLFARARKLAPCIVFIDEIDAIGRIRGGRAPGAGANDEREATLNQLLVEMDGFESGADSKLVIVLAGTNRPDVLDPALTRPGRFDRAVTIDRPDRAGRAAIFCVHLRPLVLAPIATSEHMPNQEGPRRVRDETVNHDHARKTSDFDALQAVPLADAVSQTMDTALLPQIGAKDAKNAQEQSVPNADCIETGKKVSPSAERDIKEYAGRMAELTPGFVGADIANVCNEAALLAARKAAVAVGMDHLEAAVERVVAGVRRTTKVLSPRERRLVAFHEAGHAVAGWFLAHADPLLKVSIVPHGSSALGFAQYVPAEQHLWSRAELADRMAVMLAGRAAEELVFGRDATTTGARDDIAKVTRLAYEQVAACGMSARVGALAYRHPSAGDDDYAPRAHSEETARAIDEEARVLVDAAMERVSALLKERRRELDILAERLIEREVLTRQDVAALLGPRPSPSISE